jgi:D,D-heptose 1,7-bisphosphate phosphatase
MRVRQALFLVGGRGTRLGAIAANTPKPLLEIAPGVRFLDILLQQAARHGFTNIILLAGHLGEQVEATYHGRRVHDATVTVLREEMQAGTGGALALAKDQLDPWFLMANGDTLFDINLRELAARPLEGFVGRLALREIADASRFGSVRLEDDRIVAYQEKRAGVSEPGLISAGIYLLSREILNHLDVPCSLEMKVFPGLVKAGLLRGKRFEGYFQDIGLPQSLAQAADDIPTLLCRPAAFLDRDGVLNVDKNYTHRLEDLIWIPGAREAVLKLNSEGYLVFVVTNQAGVARGYYDEAQVVAFHERMQDDLAEIGAHIDAFYYCPFHEEASVAGYRAVDHPDRKPNPGMILRAMREWKIDAARSFLIGDRESDIEAARRAGLRGFRYSNGDLRTFTDAILVRTGGGRSTGFRGP